MTAHDDPKTLGRTRLSFADESEVDEFVATLGRFERAEISPDAWRAYRLVRGVYGQRQDGVHMVRVKIPQGILSAPQLRALAEVARRYSRGFGHVTTRQNVQFHFVRPAGLDPALHVLAHAGLTTREACGNSVRNITACPYAGVAAAEVFDVTPYAEALTRYLLRHPLSSTLPRKFKIAWEGCADDHVGLGIHDIGFAARATDDRGASRRGFRVVVGGGTSIWCRAGQPLFEFLAAGEILNVVEAILRVYHARGDYQHKQRNRLKYLIDSLGWERWQQEVQLALAGVRAEGGAALPFDPEQPPAEEPPPLARQRRPTPEALRARVQAEATRGPGIQPPAVDASDTGRFEPWRRTNVRPQKQTGYCVATVRLPLGDLTAAQMDALADLAEAYGDGLARVTSEQNVLLRWVPEPELGSLHSRLAAVGLGRPDANTVADVVSCPGAESCRLAVTQSRGLGRLLGEYLERRRDLVAAAPDLQIKISGCPNGCGRHHIAGLGFQGSVRKVGRQAVPQYFVMVGGRVTQEGAEFARLVGKVPARRLPQVVERLIGLYRSRRQDGESATHFFQHLDRAAAHAAIADLEVLGAAEAQPEDFVDLAEERAFEVATLEGECSA